MINNKFILLSIVFLSVLAIACNDSALPRMENVRKAFAKQEYLNVIASIDIIEQRRYLNHEQHKLRGLSYLYTHQINDAKAELKKSFDLKNNDSETILKLAQCYLQISSDSAKIYYSKVLQFDENNFEAYNGLGLTFLNQGQNNKALRYFKKCIAMNIGFYEAYNNIGLAYANLGDHHGAVKYFNISIAKNRKDDRTFFNRGVSYLYLNENAKALKDFDLAIELNDKNSLYYLNRGMAHYLLRMPERACSDWQSSASLKNKEAEGYLIKICQ